MRSGSSYGKSFDTLFGGGSRAGGARIDQTIASQPIARLGNAEDIAAAVCWLAGLEASCITGTDLLADGGMQASLRWSKLSTDYLENFKHDTSVQGPDHVGIC